MTPLTPEHRKVVLKNHLVDLAIQMSTYENPEGSHAGKAAESIQSLITENRVLREEAERIRAAVCVAYNTYSNSLDGSESKLKAAGLKIALDSIGSKVHTTRDQMGAKIVTSPSQAASPSAASTAAQEGKIRD